MEMQARKELIMYILIYFGKIIKTVGLIFVWLDNIWNDSQTLFT